MIGVVIVVALLAGAIAATVTWSIVRHDRPAPSGAGEALDGDPTPIPAAPTSGPTWSAVVDRIPLGVVVMSSDGQVLYRNSSAKAVASPDRRSHRITPGGQQYDPSPAIAEPVGGFG